jgi:hypothetical protein
MRHCIGQDQIMFMEDGAGAQEKLPLTQSMLLKESRGCTILLAHQISTLLSTFGSYSRVVYTLESHVPRLSYGSTLQRNGIGLL